ncbi:acetyl-coa hydrolase-related [Anaeramoeba flamelloides]|uniref:Acetyl-coa hydrolase-related n=1 Tax=Anaeramoeba flamelloides TaxID=1746091 RepID=A0ABQ8YZS9_9EUKA|nr:acetyl-coa hydrolase-related [Anaeramoeba flamelloides]
MPPIVSAKESRDTVFLQSLAAHPISLSNALTDFAPRINHLNLFHLMPEWHVPYADPKRKEKFFSNNHFISSATRKNVYKGYGSDIPQFLNEQPKLYYQGSIHPEWCLLNVSPPDEHGYCSFGVDVTINIAASKISKNVLAQISPKMPRALWNCFIHAEGIDMLVEVDEPLPLYKSRGAWRGREENWWPFGRNY